MSEKRVALLKGINVGGGNKVPMADLRGIAQGLGWRDVATYIASGNMVFSAEGAPEALAGALRAALADRLGVDVPIMVLDADRVRTDLAACPYAPAEDKHVHLFFLFGPPAPDEALIAELRAQGEELSIGSGTAYFHTPEGFGNSKLAGRMPRALGCDFTARNLRTMKRLAGMMS